MTLNTKVTRNALANAVAANFNYKNKYQWFVVAPSMSGACILAGNEYREDAQEVFKEIKDEEGISCKVVARRTLERAGIDPNVSESWAKGIRKAVANANSKFFGTWETKSGTHPMRPYEYPSEAEAIRSVKKILKGNLMAGERGYWRVWPKGEDPYRLQWLGELKEGEIRNSIANSCGLKSKVAQNAVAKNARYEIDPEHLGSDATMRDAERLAKWLTRHGYDTKAVSVARRGGADGIPNDVWYRGMGEISNS